MREKTGYYDRAGKAIKDGDHVKAIIGYQVACGYVEKRGDRCFFINEDFLINLKFIDDIEILEGK